MWNIERFKNFSKEINLNDYETIETIGKGTFSKVYKVKNKNGNIYAMKVIEKCGKTQSQDQLKQVRREIENLLKCHSIKKSGVVFLIGYTETKEQFKLIFEYCDTDLEKYIKENYPNGIMPIDEIKLLFMELNDGFKNLQEKKIIHRDIKINNVLIKYRCNDKKDIIPLLGDFGISRENSNESPMTASISWALLSAPEILLNGNEYSFASDLWSIGVLLFKLAFGKYPFGDANTGIVQIYNIIQNNSHNLPKTGKKDFDDLISKLLEKDKFKRIKYEDYFNHPFFKYDEPNNLINLNKNYDLNISSYNKRIFIEFYINGNKLLEDLSKVNFVNLKELHINHCNISNLNPLESENFKNVILLNLQYNKISDLTPLKKIKFLNVKQIFLGFNYITDISILKEIGFKQLKSISFIGNKNIYINQSIIDSIISK